MLIEFKKLFKNKWFYIIFAFLLLLMIINSFLGFNAYEDEIALYKSIYKNNEEVLKTLSPLQFLLGGAYNHTPLITIFGFLFPLFTAIVFSLTIYQDQQTGHIHYILTRKSRATYYFQKYLFTFITTFFMIFIPLIIGLFLMNLLTNTWDYSNDIAIYKKLVIQHEMIEEFGASQVDTDYLPAVFLISPVLHKIILYIIFSFFAAILSIIGLATSLLMKQKYIILFMPQIICTVISIFLEIIQVMQFDILIIIQGGVDMLHIVWTFSFYFIVITLAYLIGVKRNRDVFY